MSKGNEYNNVPLSGVTLIAQERMRQITDEGCTPEHDDEHAHGQLAEAAASYTDLAAYQAAQGGVNEAEKRPPMGWPWDAQWWKPSPDPIRNLAKAGALIAAEIDRLQRKDHRDNDKEDS